ncbi:MAG: 50S ribosomal protein L29 [Candidatus Gastranaerophilales bacterium]|nr:50S ribosomal protein L29 [Candidatus Gastranaerophilales bacterium]
MKLEEMREKTVEELQTAVVDFKKQLFDLRVQKSLQKLENTAEIGNLKTKIAQAKAVIKEKQVTK